jgi:heat shock protein HslJ
VTELAGKPVPPQDVNREAHLVFEPGGRVSGSDGCNRISGGYQLKGDAVFFGQITGTQMACTTTVDIERGFREALKNATRLTMAGDRMELQDTVSRRRLAVFFGRGPMSSARTSTSPELEGTAWQLVKFQGGDGKTLLPADRTTYTIEFASGGHLVARVDCNSGTGTWKSSGANQVQFGPLALTRESCPAGSLHDQMTKQWGFIRSYIVKDGNLFLSLIADGGIYELEPVAKTKP